jgi:hypothetical protein
VWIASALDSLTDTAKAKNSDNNFNSYPRETNEFLILNKTTKKGRKKKS